MNVKILPLSYMNFIFSTKSFTILCTKFRVLNRKTEKSKQTLQKNFQTYDKSSIIKNQILVK